MSANPDEKKPAAQEVEERHPRPFSDPDGPDQTAEPDGQFPDNDPAVGTIKAPPAEDPVPISDPRPDTGRPDRDRNPPDKSRGTS